MFTLALAQMWNLLVGYGGLLSIGALVTLAIVIPTHLKIVRSLRAKVRDGVVLASPALRQLVALDAGLEGVLGEREARLMASLPSLMEKRFNQLRKAHLHARQDLPAADDKPALWMQPGAWLARFRTELQTVLLAELDLRLQPAVGLLEALHNDKTLQAV